MRSRVITAAVVLLCVGHAVAVSQEVTQKLAGPSSLPSDERIWTDDAGKYQVAAVLVAYRPGFVQLQKIDGTKISLPLERLSEKDQIFVAQATALRVEPDKQVILGKVVNVLDSDTLRVANALESVRTIRLDGVDAPESGQRYAEQAAEFLQDYVGKSVRVEFSEKDLYQRILGQVYFEEKWINREIVLHGLAWHYKKYSKNKILAAAENHARENKLNIWSDSKRIAPWDWRNGVRVETSEAVNAPSTRTTDTPVYITETGTHYHRDGCRHLSKSKILIPLSRAKSAYTPCKHCNPPT